MWGGLQARKSAGAVACLHVSVGNGIVQWGAALCIRRIDIMPNGNEVLCRLNITVPVPNISFRQQLQL